MTHEYLMIREQPLICQYYLGLERPLMIEHCLIGRARWAVEKRNLKLPEKILGKNCNICIADGAS